MPVVSLLVLAFLAQPVAHRVEVLGRGRDAYWAAGRKLEATYQWRRALTFHPEPDDAAKLEAKLQGENRPTVVSGQ